MSKTSKIASFFLNIAVTCEEQAQQTMTKITEETSAEQARKITHAANNLVRVAGVSSASTSHAEELRALSETVSDAEVAKLFKTCKIDASKIAALAKYNKAKVNATFASVARSILPDWTKNDQNAFVMFELLKKSGKDAVTLQQIQRMLGHSTLTQASYISNLWRALGVADERGSKADRTLHVKRDSLLAQHVARMYGLTWSAKQEQQEEQASAEVIAQADSAENAQASA